MESQNGDIGGLIDRVENIGQAFLAREIIGAIGLISQDGNAAFDNPEVWEMNLLDVVDKT